jgi:hypothetical protein
MVRTACTTTTAPPVTDTLCDMRSWKLLHEPRYVPLVSHITREASS